MGQRPGELSVSAAGLADDGPGVLELRADSFDSSARLRPGALLALVLVTGGASLRRGGACHGDCATTIEHLDLERG